MKIEVSSGALLLALRNLRDIIADEEYNGEIPVAITAVADTNTVYIRGGNPARQASLRISPGTVLEPGVAAAGIDQLIDACAAFRHVRFVVCGDELKRVAVLSGDARIEMDVTATPAEIEGMATDAARADIGAREALDAIDAVIHAMCADESRNSLMGVNIELERGKSMTVVATDGRRMAWIEQRPETAEFAGEKFAAFLPTPAVRFMLFAPNGDKFAVIKGEKSVKVLTEGCVGVFGLPGRLFPAWRQCIPYEPRFRVALPAGRLSECLSTFLYATHSDYMDDAPGGIYLECKDERVILYTELEGSGVTRLRAEFHNDSPPPEPFRVLVNAIYLQDALRFAVGTVNVAANELASGQMGPLLLTFPAKPEYREVIMPMRNPLMGGRADT